MRITSPPAVGLIATHAVLTSGVHGIGSVLCTLTGAETLTNKIIGAGGLTFTNEGVGADPVLSSDNASQRTTLTGGLIATLDLIWQAGTGYSGILTHAISASRTYTFPDVTGNIIIDGDTGKSLSLAQLTIENVGVGADAILTSNSGVQALALAGKLVVTGLIHSSQNLVFVSATAFEGILNHAISASRTWTFPDVAGIVCMWDADNAAVTRYWSVGYRSILGMLTTRIGSVTLEDGNDYIETGTATTDTYFTVNLPHGAIITAFRGYVQKNGATDTFNIIIVRYAHSDGTRDVLGSFAATQSMAEGADTSISNATVDNNTYGYAVEINKLGTTDKGVVRSIQIDYTVVRPQP